jgi:hypothetical protein
MRCIGLFTFAFCLCWPGFSQNRWREPVPRHNLSVGLGAAIPSGDLGAFYDNGPNLAVSYGYRFHPNFQADIGFDAVSGSAGVNSFLSTSFGALRIRDRQYFLPFGGRAILPLGRLLVYGGGGGAWMTYREQLLQPDPDFRFACPPCTSRSGWGYYAQSGFDLFLDRNRFFRLGAGVRSYRGRTDGERVGLLPGIASRDRWLVVAGHFGISF